MMNIEGHLVRLATRRLSVFSTLCLSAVCALGQTQSVSVFAHNDYVHARPFDGSYDAGVDYMEADVFYRHGDLLVAHTALEIKDVRTLADLYLEPLSVMVRANNGFAYSQHDKPLTLMVDLKTDGAKTLQALVEELKKFPELVTCSTLTIAVSGNVPPPAEWSKYPPYIHFDGRPTIRYSPEQLERISLISASFRDYSSWNGRGEMSNDDRLKLENVVKKVHAMGRPIRFWAAPDYAVAWRLLINLGVDVINTDDVEGFRLYQKD